MDAHSLASILLGLLYPLAFGWVVKQHNDATKTIAGIHNETVRQVAQAGLAVATALAAGGAAKAGTWTEKHGIAPAEATSSLIGAFATGQSAAPSAKTVTPGAPA